MHARPWADAMTLAWLGQRADVDWRERGAHCRAAPFGDQRAVHFEVAVDHRRDHGCRHWRAD